MTTDYEEPNSGISGYGSLSSRQHIYKASQIRGTSHYARPRSIRRLGSKVSTGNGMIAYFVFTIIVCAFNLAATCYLIVTSETRSSSCFTQTKQPKPTGGIEISDQIDQLMSSVNTMMTALTYTLPQVLNTNKLSLQTRLNHLASEMRDLIRMNSLELDVKLALNRSILLKSGSKNHQTNNWTKENMKPLPTMNPYHRIVTLVPRKVPTPRGNLPFTKLRDPDINPKVVGYTTTLDVETHDDTASRNDDYTNMAPLFK